MDNEEIHRLIQNLLDSEDNSDSPSGYTLVSEEAVDSLRRFQGSLR